MSHLIAAVALLLTGSAHAADPARDANAAALAGAWVDTLGTHHTIDTTDAKHPSVTVTGVHGEVYPVTTVRWQRSALRWHYTVPSTRVHVVMRTREVTADKVVVDWVNDLGLGLWDTLKRPTPPPTE